MAPNERATMLYDGDCGFCQYWIERWRRLTKDAIIYEPYQEALTRFPQVTEEECREAVQLITKDGAVFSGAHAVFEALRIAGRFRALHWLYDHSPFFGRFSEFLYQWVSHHRFVLSKFFGSSVKKCG